MSETNSEWEEKTIFKCIAFPRNTFVFPHKYICILSQNFCVLSRNFALPRKTLAFSLPVQHFLFTLCFQWFRQLHTFIMEQFIEFYFELGLKYKEIRSVLSTRHGFDVSDRQLKMIFRKKRIVSTENLLGVTSGAGPRAVGTERGRWSNW